MRYGRTPVVGCTQVLPVKLCNAKELDDAYYHLRKRVDDARTSKVTKSHAGRGPAWFHSARCPGAARTSSRATPPGHEQRHRPGLPPLLALTACQPHAATARPRLSPSPFRVIEARVARIELYTQDA